MLTPDPDKEKNSGTSLILRIDWSELDLFGHVNNVMFYKYIQAARVNYWEVMGLYGSFRETRQGPVLAAGRCDFRKPLFYPGNVHIRTNLEFMKTTSFGFVHLLTDDSGDLCARAHDVVVMYDFNREIKMPVSAAMRRAAEKIEGRVF